MEVYGKKSGEWAKSRKESDRKSIRTRQKNKRGDTEKWDQIESPDISDSGETSEFPGLQSGALSATNGVPTQRK